MTTAKVSKKGWVVIPKEIRDRHGIKPGDEVQIVDYAGRIAIYPAIENPVDHLHGLLKEGPSLTKALLEERQKEKDLEERKIARGAKRSKSTT
jgi:AbrB family looped-hinge helix DNA binding protein